MRDSGAGAWCIVGVRAGLGIIVSLSDGIASCTVGGALPDENARPDVSTLYALDVRCRPAADKGGIVVSWVRPVLPVPGGTAVAVLMLLSRYQSVTSAVVSSDVEWP